MTPRGNALTHKSVYLRLRLTLGVQFLLSCGLLPDYKEVEGSNVHLSFRVNGARVHAPACGSLIGAAMASITG